MFYWPSTGPDNMFFAPGQGIVNQSQYLRGDKNMNKISNDILKIIHKKIIIISSNINDTSIKKYLKQYNNVRFINNDSYHDRFIIIDRKIVYHCGASFKDLGKKCFAINEIENKIENDKLINDVIKNCSIDN